MKPDPFPKWWPHIRPPRLKKIVAVTFEDGAIIQVEDAELELGGYLKCLADRRMDADLRKVGLPPLTEFRTMQRAWISVQASDRASKPRKAATKKATPAKVLKFKNEWQARYPGKRGWLKAASVHFKVSEKRLREIYRA